MGEIQSLLESINDAKSENQLAIDNVKEWLREYLAMYAEEISEFPNESDKDHWDLVAADYDASKDATFVVAFFTVENVVFVGGNGDIAGVRDFASDSYPENPSEVIRELRSRFSVAEREIAMSIDALTSWLDG